MNKRILSLATAAVIATTSNRTIFRRQPSVTLDTPDMPSAPIGRPSVSPNAAQKAPVKTGTQKVLCLMIEPDDITFSSDHNEKYYSDTLFGSQSDSVKSFVNNQSGGKFNIEPAKISGAVAPGVMRVKMKNNLGTVAAKDHDKQIQLVQSALNRVEDKVDWADADSNNDKKFEESFRLDDPSRKEELLVYAIVAGEVKSPTDSQEGKIVAWPHLTQLRASAGGYIFDNSAIITSEVSEDVAVNSAVLSHEFLHNLNARDMYKDQESIGIWSVMCNSYGKLPGSNLFSPPPLDPIHKLYMGWAEENVIDYKGTPITIPYDKNKINIVQHPTNKDICYVLDYRDWDDPNVKALNGFGLNKSGMVVWIVHKDQARKDWFDNDWYVNTAGAGTSMNVLVTGQGSPTLSNSFIAEGQGATIDGHDMVVVVNKDKSLKICSKDDINGGGGVIPEEKITIEASDREIPVGPLPDFKKDVIVRDGKGQIITDKCNIKVKVNVDSSKVGEGTVEYTVSYGGVIEKKTIKVSVKEDAESKPIPAPVITAPNMEIFVGDSFNPMKGVSAKDGAGDDITASVKVIDDKVNPKVAGTYQVVYEVADRYGQKVTYKRTVIVKDKNNPSPDPTKDTEPPVIKGAEAKVIHQGDKFDPMAGVTAVDNSDGPVSVKITKSDLDINKPGKYSITYEAMDKAGNRAELVRGIQVIESGSIGQDVEQDKEFPELKAVDTKLKIPAGHKIDPKNFVTATDNVDGDLTGKIVIKDNNADLSKAGTYKINYSVTDSSGNKSECDIEFVIYDNQAQLYAPDMKVKVGDKFEPMTRVSAILSNGLDAIDLVKADGTVDTSKPGKYPVTYSFRDINGKEVKATRNVEVVSSGDVALPEINFGRSVYTKGGNFNILNDIKTVGADASDVKVIAGDIDFNTTGYYPVAYEVTDKNGNKVQKIRYVVVTKNDVKQGAPVISVITNKVHRGDKFDPKKIVVALDYEDGLLNNKLVVEQNDVNTVKIGRYTVKYSVVDSDGNVTSKSVDVDVLGEADLKPSDTNKEDSKKPEKKPGGLFGGNKITTGNPNPGKLDGYKSQLTDLTNDPSAKASLPKTGAVASVGGLAALVLAFISRRRG